MKSTSDNAGKSNPFFHDMVFLLIIILLTFIPLITNLGYYKDDWHVTWAGVTQGGAKIFDMHKIDRPFMGLYYGAVFDLIGASPIVWHFYALFIRILSSAVFLWLVRLIWPAKRRATLIMGILFALYPGFLVQPIASMHQTYLFASLMGLLSLAFTIRAFQTAKPSHKGLWIAGSALSAALCYLIMEWMLGLETVRIVLLWYLAQKENEQKKSAAIFKSALLHDLPNLAAVVLFLIWRLFFFKSARAATDVGDLLSLYRQSPLNMGLRIVLDTGRDFFETVFLAWGVPLYNLASEINYADLLIGLALATAGVLCFLFIFKQISKPGTEEDGFNTPHVSASWSLDALWLGLFWALITLVPVVAANRGMQFQDTFDRYTLLASGGVAIAVTGMIETFLQNRFKFMIASLLIAVAILTHYSNAAYYRDFWKIQQQLWWQFSWRVPDLADGTTVIAQFPQGYRLAEGYETWGPLNLIYNSDSPSLRIMGETLNDETLPDMLNEKAYGKVFRRISTTIDFKNSLVISIPGAQTCMHIQDSQNLEISSEEDAMIRLLAPHSKLSLINTEQAGHTPAANIFGSEPTHGWCYYYQKAELARQKKDWAEVVRLGDEVRSQGLKPVDLSEWMPFYEGYARLSKFDQANEISATLRLDSSFIDTFCSNHSLENTNSKYILQNLCAP